MAFLIPIDGVPREETPGRGGTFTVAELEHFVGGYLKAIGLDDGRVMFVNEDGNRDGLAVNATATELVAMSGLAPGVSILGPAIVCTRAEIAEDNEEE